MAAFQTGTVAGTITLTPSFTSGGTALPGASPRLIRILRSARPRCARRR